MITVFNEKYIFTGYCILGDFWSKFFAAFTDYRTISKTLIIFKKFCRATYVYTYCIHTLNKSGLQDWEGHSGNYLKIIRIHY